MKSLIPPAVSVMYTSVFGPFAIDLQVVIGSWQAFCGSVVAEHLSNGQMQ